MGKTWKKRDGHNKSSKHKPNYEDWSDYQDNYSNSYNTKSNHRSQKKSKEQRQKFEQKMKDNFLYGTLEILDL